MHRRTRSHSNASNPCFLKAALPLFLLLLNLALPAKALSELEDAASYGKRSSLDGMGPPSCTTGEDLCPVSPGSDELKCVDFSDLKTCGGCMTDGEGVDCTSVQGYFMLQCTRRGQCSGCRWKRGGINQSLSEPDYLSCSVILSAPVKQLRPETQRNATLSYARLVEKLHVKAKPMAARLAHKAELAAAAKDATARGVVDPIGRLKPDAQRLAQARLGVMPATAPGKLPIISTAEIQAFGLGLEDVGMSIFNPSHLPQPPTWLVNFISSRLRSLPLSTEDDALLAWVRTLKEPLSLAARQLKPQAAAPEKKGKKKITNAERFKLQLPPVAPKAIDERPNKPAPFRLPGVEYTDQEIEAMGWDDLKIKNSPAATLAAKELENSKIWLQVLIVAMYSADTAKEMRKDVLESLWQLLDFVAQAEEHKMGEYHKAIIAGGSSDTAVEKEAGVAAKAAVAPVKKVDSAKEGTVQPAVAKQAQAKEVDVKAIPAAKAAAAEQVVLKPADRVADKATAGKKEAPQIAAAPKKDDHKAVGQDGASGEPAGKATDDKQKPGMKQVDEKKQQVLAKAPEKEVKQELGAKERIAAVKQADSKLDKAAKGEGVALKKAEEKSPNPLDTEKEASPKKPEVPKPQVKKPEAHVEKPEAKQLDVQKLADKMLGVKAPEQLKAAVKKPEAPAKKPEEKKPDTPKPIDSLPKDKPTPQQDPSAAPEAVLKLDTDSPEPSEQKPVEEPEESEEPQEPDEPEKPNSDLDALLGLRAMLDAKERELSSLREQIEARLGSFTPPKKKKQKDVPAPVKVADSKALLQQVAAKKPMILKKPGMQPAEGAVKPKEATHDHHEHEAVAVNAFEEHVRLAKVDQVKKKEAKVQPELNILETEELSAGAAEIKANRPWIAGVAKARPNAHKGGIDIVPAYKKRE